MLQCPSIDSLTWDFILGAGTTIAGVHELEKAGVRAAFMNAVTVAATKADSLASI